MPCQRFDFLLKVLKKIYLVSKHFQSMRWNRNIIPLHRRSLVVLHLDHHLLLHRQPRGLPHGGEDGHPHREGGRPGWSVCKVGMWAELFLSSLSRTFSTAPCWAAPPWLSSETPRLKLTRRCGGTWRARSPLSLSPPTRRAWRESYKVTTREYKVQL